jgi:hypothetical protein
MRTERTAVRSMAEEVAYTLTMVSAYFMIQDTNRPLKAKFTAMAHVTQFHPCSPLFSQDPFSYPPPCACDQ